MLVSMTGFAEKIVMLPINGQQLTLTLNIKSLNARFFETTCKLPYALSVMEMEITQLFKARLKRGHIFFSINLSNAALLKGSVEPALPIIKSYIDAISSIAQHYNLPGQLTIDDLIKLPNVFSIEEKGLDENLKSFILKAAQELLDTLIQTRIKEGAMLEADIRQRCELITTAIQNIERISQDFMEQRKKEIAKNLQELGTATDNMAEAQRVMLYNELNKIDIHEEIVRFNSHLHNIQAILSSSDLENGKRLDFTLQELAREINTIAAKSSDAAISTSAINIKVELEKIREQAQNIV